MKKNPNAELAKTYEAEIQEIKKKTEGLALTHDADEDYEEARSLLKRLIEKSEEALDSLLAFTHESEHPRAYEVLSGLIKTSSDLASQLITLQKNRHQLDQLNRSEKSNEINLGSNTTNNTAVFVGNTSELQKYLKANNVIDIT